MRTYNNIEEYLKDLKKRLKSQMPKIRDEIRVYEKKVKEGKLNQILFLLHNLMNKPILLVIAGCNGSGKLSFSCRLQVK